VFEPIDGSAGTSRASAGRFKFQFDDGPGTFKTLNARALEGEVQPLALLV
jgi:hypothetical protein